MRRGMTVRLLDLEPGARHGDGMEPGGLEELRRPTKDETVPACGRSSWCRWKWALGEKGA